MPYVNLEQVKRYLKIEPGETVDDLLLEECIDRAQTHIEEETRRVFVAWTAVTRQYDAVEDVCGDTLNLDFDLLVATKIINGNGATISLSTVTYKPANNTPKYQIVLKSGSWTWKNTPIDAIKVTGDWGYCVAPPNDIKQAHVRLAAYFYRQKDAQTFDVTSYYEGGVMTIPQGVPRYVQMVIDRYRRTI